MGYVNIGLLKYILYSDTFSVEMYSWMDGWMEGWMDRRIEGWIRVFKCLIIRESHTKWFNKSKSPLEVRMDPIAVNQIDDFAKINE